MPKISARFYAIGAALGPPIGNREQKTFSPAPLESNTALGLPQVLHQGQPQDSKKEEFLTLDLETRRLKNESTGGETVKALRDRAAGTLRLKIRANIFIGPK
jgi:hypothetical protein